MVVVPADIDISIGFSMSEIHHSIKIERGEQTVPDLLLWSYHTGECHRLIHGDARLSE